MSRMNARPQLQSAGHHHCCPELLEGFAKVELRLNICVELISAHIGLLLNLGLVFDDRFGALQGPRCPSVVQVLSS